MTEIEIKEICKKIDNEANRLHEGYGMNLTADRLRAISFELYLISKNLLQRGCL